MKHQTSGSSATPAQRVPAKKVAHAATHAQAAGQQQAGHAAEREAMIREAAYLCYERRGCVYGHELEDWLAAEAQVDEELARAAQALASPGR